MQGDTLGSLRQALAPLIRDSRDAVQAAFERMESDLARQSKAIARSETWDVEHAEELLTYDPNECVEPTAVVDRRHSHEVYLPSIPVDWWPGPEIESLSRALKEYGLGGDWNLLQELLAKARRVPWNSSDDRLKCEMNSLQDLLGLLNEWLGPLLAQQKTAQGDAASTTPTANVKKPSSEEARNRLVHYIGLKRKRPWTVRELAKKVGLSAAWVSTQREWRKYYRGTDGAMPAAHSRKAAVLSNAVLGRAGEDDPVLQRLMDEESPAVANEASLAMRECDLEIQERQRQQELEKCIAEQTADFEPSPFDNSPSSRRRFRKEL